MFKIVNAAETNPNNLRVLVEFEKPHTTRYIGTNNFIDVTHAWVSARRVPMEDGTDYTETAVVGAEPDGAFVKAYLYLVTGKILSLEEAMFLLGELETPTEPVYAGATDEQ